jgi:hypothetical protein
MTKRSDHEEAPRFKALLRKDYIDYDKYKHFHESNLDDTVALSPILPGTKEEQPERKKLNKKTLSMKLGKQD